MLPKRERLSRTEFNRFFAAGKRAHSPSFQLVYAPHPSLHVSVVVPKKIVASAVKRNVIRRRIYDIVRHCRDEKKLHGVIIFLTKPEVSKKTYEALKEEVRTAIGKVVQ